MFRDLEHRDNLLDGRTFHAAGIVHSICSVDSYSGKDINVEYIDPFTLDIINTWRATKEVELFEVPQYLHERCIDFIESIRNGK